ncbi:MAG: aspartate carbamoyltransferase [Eubacteriaceae bacterium]|jgi:aspartate carbamoyltransferase catalytic subunit|nr:aspartate carbamoyltransferase [Eubacteriaceae bacterium]
MNSKHFILPTDLSVEELDGLFELADSVIEDCRLYRGVCRGMVMASLFFEPSTRTKFSFDAAMYRLGGNVLGFSDPATTSQSKGESLLDTTRIIASYSDIIVVRSPFEGAAKLMGEASSVPVINGGDGGHEHPTQTLTDLMTIRHYKGSFEGHTIGICGDLKFGRTIHSLIRALARYSGNRFVFISPDELRLPSYVLKSVEGRLEYIETKSLSEALGGLDILYMSRVQKERFVSEAEYLRLRDYYILDAAKMEKAKKSLIVMHPLPRVNEIAADVDKDPRAVYFEQVKFGMYVRMALIMTMLDMVEAASD